MVLLSTDVMFNKISSDLPKVKTLTLWQRLWGVFRLVRSCRRHRDRKMVSVLNTLAAMTQGHKASMAHYAQWSAWHSACFQRESQGLLSKSSEWSASTRFFIVPESGADTQQLQQQSWPHWQLVTAIDDVPEEAWLFHLPQGCVLEPHFLLHMAGFIAEHSKVELVYCDDDQLGADGSPHSPRFKPHWNPDWLTRQDYVGVAFVCRKRLCGGGAELAKAWSVRGLWCNGSLNAESVVGRVPRVLLHDQQFESPVIHQPVHVLPDDLPLVSILIPTRDALDLLRPCVMGVLQKTDYTNIEILIIDNGSEDGDTLQWLRQLVEDEPRVRVLRDDSPFNYAALNNRAAEEARGELLLLLNNDVEVIDKDWLQVMVYHALREDIACVGGMLLYADGRVQHAGIQLGTNGGSGHGHRYFNADEGGYCDRLKVEQNVAAVTGACLMVRKAVYQQLGGLDAEHLAVAWNDVDLCLKASEAGYRNLWTPLARLYHHESVSRGRDRSPLQRQRYLKETTWMQERWGEQFWNDPYYHPMLTSGREDFSLNLYGCVCSR